jgi:hypothetical protein
MKEADVDSVSDAPVATSLEWDAQDRAEAIEAVRRSDHAAAEGRERPLSDFITDQRSKRGFPASWPR